MNIIPFSHAQQEMLLERALQAHRLHHHREAYEFLREAIKFGENAIIFNRAATLLNEMGEYEGTLQVSSYAIKCQPENPHAAWERAIACERLWKLDEALSLIQGLPPSFAPSSSIHPDLLAGICHLKKGNITEVRKILFRHAGNAEMPEPLHTRLTRLEECLNSSPQPGSLDLKKWLWIMRGHILLHSCSLDHPFELHLMPERHPPSTWKGEHYVLGYPSFRDCGRILLGLRRQVFREDLQYQGIYPCDPSSMGLAQALSIILEIPIIESHRLAGHQKALLCMASHSGKSFPHVVHGRASRHDLFILAKTFEREEFHDVVAPPHQAPLVNAWADPIPAHHRQIIGAVGEFFSLPWEQTSLKAYEAHPGHTEMDSILSDFRVPSTWSSMNIEEPLQHPRIAHHLIQAYEKVLKE